MKHPKRKQLNIGTWNLTSWMTPTLVLMSLFSFQIADAQGQNQAQATIQHIFPVGSDSDIVLDEPALANEQWGWFVMNAEDDTGQSMENVTFTATTDLHIIWDPLNPPSSESPPIYVWDYGVDVPEDFHYGAGGEVPGSVRSPGLTAKRGVTPAVLDGPETVQVVVVEIIFNSFPTEEIWNIVVAIGLGNIVGPDDDDLISIELISQNDVGDDWWERSWGGRLEWQNSSDVITLGVPYKFIAKIRSIKSPLIISSVTSFL